MNSSNQKPTYREYIEGTRRILEKSKDEAKPYKVMVLGREFIVHPNVFSPKYFHDTALFAENLPVQEGEEMLEIGPGTGAISLTAIYKGAKKVVAIDVNPDAVKNTQANIELHNMAGKVEVRQGNIFESLKPDEKFDTIFWNTPFGFIEQDEVPDLEKAVYDPHYKSTERFIKEAKEHLKKGGRVLIGFSTTLGRLDLLQNFVDEADLSLRLLYEVESEEIHPVKFEIFEALPKK
ncbi:MAG: N-methyl-transferase [Parcubacteria group bacterium GW2011_GWA2_47_64]|nr:MAG: N-methyl-transferase [Parcubacteria group bacterium GW2011_GWA2_47_64]KKU96415.1 MAG: N-methyl-transferase [Parcubacteria group bacterium GW2011_GWC2_48_17]